MQNIEKDMEKKVEENMENREVVSRRRNEIKKIQNNSDLYTAFTKRRNGLLSKTRDLCTHCGANAAVIVFSPDGRPYVFGSPSVDSIIDRYLNERSLKHVDGNNAGSSASEQCTESVPESGDNFWWNRSIEGLDIHQLKEYKDSLLELRKSVVNQLEERRMRNMASRNFLTPDSTVNK